MIQYKFLNTYSIFYLGEKSSIVPYRSQHAVYLTTDDKPDVAGVLSGLSRSKLEDITRNIEKILNDELPDPSIGLSFIKTTSPAHWLKEDDRILCSTKDETVVHRLNYRDEYIGVSTTIPTNELLKIVKDYIVYLNQFVNTKPRVIYHNYQLLAEHLNPYGISLEGILAYFRVTSLKSVELGYMKYEFFSSYQDVTKIKVTINENIHRFGLEFLHANLHHHLIVRYQHHYFCQFMWSDITELKEIVSQITIMLDSDKLIEYSWYNDYLYCFCTKMVTTIICRVSYDITEGDTQSTPTIEVLQMLKDFIAYIESRSDMPLRIDRDNEEFNEFEKLGSFH